MSGKPIHKYVAPLLVAIGVALIVIAAITAYSSFYGYRLPTIRGSTLEESITLLINALVDIAVRLGFLGVVVWAGGVLLKHGVQLFRVEHAVVKSGETS